MLQNLNNRSDPHLELYFVDFKYAVFVIEVPGNDFLFNVGKNILINIAAACA